MLSNRYEHDTSVLLKSNAYVTVWNQLEKGDLFKQKSDLFKQKVTFLNKKVTFLNKKVTS